MKTAATERRQALLARLDEVAASLRAAGGLGLIGLGSVGVERERLDQWSDLDFFAVVPSGRRDDFITDTAWLAGPRSLAFLFRNTADGYKLLWEDGIFAEMAVFDPEGLAKVPFAPGAWVWRHESLDPALASPANPGYPSWKPESAEWCLGELLTCLYVGLGRWRRGERLSGWRFVQSHCLDRFLEITSFWEAAKGAFPDPYSKDRRFEALYPEAAALLPRILLGMDRVPEAALAFLDWLEPRMAVNPALAGEIRKLAAG